MIFITHLVMATLNIPVAPLLLWSVLGSVYRVDAAALMLFTSLAKW